MQTLIEVYADLLLKQCKSNALHISFDLDCFELAEVLEEKAHKLGIKDIYLELDDTILDIESLMTMYDIKELNKISFNKYALKNADFIILKTKLKNINQESLMEMNEYKREKLKTFYNKMNELNIIYGIMPNKNWAKEKYPFDFNCCEKLFNLIIDNYSNIPCDLMIEQIDQINNNIKIKK